MYVLNQKVLVTHTLCYWQHGMKLSNWIEYAWIEHIRSSTHVPGYFLSCLQADCQKELWETTADLLEMRTVTNPSQAVLKKIKTKTKGRQQFTSSISAAKIKINDANFQPFPDLHTSFQREPTHTPEEIAPQVFFIPLCWSVHLWNTKTLMKICHNLSLRYIDDRIN